ncbi:hypothetical protein COV61_01990 [Candidatus Micrarchaeota archaeon CG11_big_fil_rev_8_21_14_0_20_47_5]|nr:MAG: hypothetical protein AUJ17_04540 [Candidatus Micrarchaeota archaeon CG1_02_47_40]PIN83825.1 MAG: hypothetical protein COV61_01990 [Candidatus Micrarchaeota archaeon CG11_big_fil_rev_8_21_14_0_20_47_5]
MYKWTEPKPIIIDLSGEEGFKIRQKAAEFVSGTRLRTLEAGSEEEQTYGILAEMVIRKELGLPEPDAEHRELGYDIKLPSGVKVDVKCRGGTLPFQELYSGSGNLAREAKHNFFARQLWDERLDSDIYVMTHLETPKPPRKQKTALPGTPRQRKWKIYVCGWVSKKRVKKEGVYLPRGAITEQGSKWFPYRGHEIEFYNRHLNGFSLVKDICNIDQKDVEEDGGKTMALHLTSVDAMRIAIDLVGYGVLDKDVLEFLKQNLRITDNVPPILHPNQYYHLLKWLKKEGKIRQDNIDKLSMIMQEAAYKE